MIISKIQGGLGNQLFQYATGRMLSLKHNVPLLLDLSWFENNQRDTKREFKLNKFNCQYSVASYNDLLAFEHKPSNFFITKLKKLEDIIHSRKVIVEHSFKNINPHIFKAPKNTFLSGYWQSEAYFLKIKDVLKKELSINNNNLFFSKITANKTITIGIHVRRGDYVTNPIYKKKFGTCSLDYYKNAINYINMHTINAHYYIFSDDISWCKLNLKIQHPHEYVQTKSDIEDFALLKQCHHQIIANSSFSWWAAWLNTNNNKIVIAPNQWQNNASTNGINLRLPSNWITL
ncbi:alpha-1,2-fucosyltransferase [Plebeiibacterium sediminum]|uniref:Alpha-1,2-fucosyltransferase n=1 Tax=Plebeiibacterium sediminum TaxID=2992112 RepID=A0AAE3SH57_9BACT|nr:alpha-1,2-fucosyltransferase [Plebeiobacterium sediminum]MCW3789193.1 alpha-1,2-fucosyltransferase [Plebeiobacterium sediminum]